MTEAPGGAALTIRAGLGVQESDSDIDKHGLPGLPGPPGYRETPVRLCSSSFKPLAPELQPRVHGPWAAYRSGGFAPCRPQLWTTLAAKLSG